MTARADCAITYCKNILQKVIFIPITLCSNYLKSENEQKTSFLSAHLLSKNCQKTHFFFIKFNSPVLKYAIKLTKVSYEKYRTYVFFLYPVWGIEESKGEVSGEGKKSRSPYFPIHFSPRNHHKLLSQKSW